MDADQAYLGDHVLVSTVKRYDRLVFHAIRSFVQGSLRGGIVRVGLRDEAVGIVGIGPSVPEEIRRRVARLVRDVKQLTPERGASMTPLQGSLGRLGLKSEVLSRPAHAAVRVEPNQLLPRALPFEEPVPEPRRHPHS